ncbi:MAG: ABC transporter ATP-binding protein, partial [Sarcina sp.]
NTSLSIGAFAGYFIVFSLGAMNLAKGIGSFGTLTALLQLFSYIQGPFAGLAAQLPAVVSALAATERLMEIENISMEKFNNEEYHNILEKNIPVVNIKDVNFSYKNDTPILENISLTIKPGEIVALVGPSGQGKTTLIKLILSFITAKKGEITLSYNNRCVNLNSIHRSLIAYVPQGNTLFSGTIKDNIIYGNKYANEVEIEEATKIACAWEFINNLPNKFDTVIGEKGLGLSEGQAQRIAIARAIIMKKPILILDEATSALDELTEMKVLQCIKNLKHKPTCIIITHRPSALEICNRILKLNKTEINELNEVG